MNSIAPTPDTVEAENAFWQLVDSRPALRAPSSTLDPAATPCPWWCTRSHTLENGAWSRSHASDLIRVVAHDAPLGKKGPAGDTQFSWWNVGIVHEFTHVAPRIKVSVVPGADDRQIAEVLDLSADQARAMAEALIAAADAANEIPARGVAALSEPAATITGALPAYVEHALTDTRH